MTKRGANFTLGGEAFVIKKNPWCNTAVGCKKEDIVSKKPIPPWARSRQGRSAMSEAQKRVVDNFSRVASRENEPQECRQKRGMARNVCRIQNIKRQLKDTGRGGAPRPRQRQAPRQRAYRSRY